MAPRTGSSAAYRPRARGPVRRFVRRYGWRAYALPVLSAVTVAVILHPTGASQATATTGTRTPAGSQHAAVAVAGWAAPPTTIDLSKDRTPCTQNAQSQLILVSIEEQRVWMCAGRTQVYSTLVTTGAIHVGDGTPLGTWHVQDKQTDRYLTGPGYRDYVHWWMPFDGDFGFHDSPWQTMPYGAAGYLDNGSHGCVHLPGKAMNWLYTWAQVGATVTIQA